MDFNAWSQQGRDYEALKNGTAWNKVVHWFSDSDATHPYAPVRAYEAMNWEKTDTCNWLRSNKFTIEFELEKKEKKQLEDKNQEEEKTGKGWNIPNIPNIPKNIDISIPKFKGFKK